MTRLRLRRPRLTVDARAVVTTAGGFVLLVGLLALAGWVWDVPFLKGPLRGLVQMKADTAVGLVALSGGLLLTITHASRGRRHAVDGLAGVAILIGALTLAEYVLGRNFGIDQLLFRDTSTVHTVHPGRLAPQTAICFMALGLSLLLSSRRGGGGRRLAAILTGGPFALALFAVLGYLYGAPALDGVPSMTPMALYTAVMLLSLCVGVAAADPDGVFVEMLTVQAPGSLVARSLLPLGLIGLPVLGSLRLEGERLGLYSSATGVALLVSASVIVLGLAVLSLSSRLNRSDRERRQALADERRLAALVDASSEAIMSADLEGRVNTWNKAAEALFGYSSQEIIGQPMGVLYPPEHHAEQREVARAVLGSQGSRQIDTQRLHRDGSRLDVSITLSTVVEGGSVTGISGIAHDISSRIQAREELSALLRERTRELDEARLEAFEKLALAGEYRDDETRDHTRRVGEISAALAAELGLDDAMVEIIRQVAPLHDLGKIGIPDSILLKPGKLTAGEYATMKEHARIGAEILSGSDSPLFLVAAQIASLHHERWDGTGYPDGQAGLEIPIAARIVGLVDVFDALTHERPYKAAWPLQEALDEIQRSSGTHFDPAIATAFAQLDHLTLLSGSEARPSNPLSQTTLTTFRAMRPSAGLGVSAADERWIAGVFRDTTRALLLADDERRYVAANDAACRLLGIGAD
jgi:PAS domain S-box-containing protein